MKQGLDGCEMREASLFGGSLPAMPTQTMAGGDDADIDGAPPVDDEAILETGRAVNLSYRGAEGYEQLKSEVLRNEVERKVKSLAGQNFG